MWIPKEFQAVRKAKAAAFNGSALNAMIRGQNKRRRKLKVQPNRQKIIDREKDRTVRNEPEE